MRHAATGMYAGIQFILTFLLFLFLGYLVDRKMDTGVGFLANGAVVGFLVGIWRLNRQGRQIMADTGKDKQTEAAPSDEESDEPAGPADQG